jgi:uncharacterized protein YraI
VATAVLAFAWLAAGGAPAHADASRTLKISVSEYGLRVRSGPSTKYRAVGGLFNGDRVRVICTSTGSTVHGSLRTTNVWAKIGHQKWVSDAFIDHGPPVPDTGLSRQAGLPCDPYKGPLPNGSGPGMQFDDPSVDVSSVELRCGGGPVYKLENYRYSEDPRKVQGGCPLGVPGSWRIVATCNRPLWKDPTVYGEWMSDGADSVADCGWFRVSTARLEFRH